MKRAAVALLVWLGMVFRIFPSADAETLQPLRFAVAAMVSPEETFKTYVEITSYLSQTIQREILLKQRRTYEEVNRLLGRGDIDFAWLCTGGFLEARRDFGAEPLATPLFQGVPFYYAYVIVPRDSPVKAWDQLRGKTFAFTDPLSFTGRIYPAYLEALRSKKADRFFGRSFYTHSHDRAIEAVAHGLADGASVDSLVYEYLLALKPEIISRTRIIHVSQPFGAPPIVASPKMERKWRHRVQEAFLQMGKDSQGIALLSQLRVEGFAAPAPDLYNETHRVWQGADPEQIAR